MKLQFERLLAMIEYAKQTALMKKNPAQNISQHKEFAKLQDQIVGLPGVVFTTGTPDEDADAWLTIDRLHETQPPVPKNCHLAAWIDCASSPNTPPSLKKSLAESALVALGLREPADPLEPLQPPAQLGTAAEPQGKLLVEKTVSQEEYDALLALREEEPLAVQLKKFTTTEWAIWARQEKEIRKSIALYKEMFLLCQRLQGNLIDTALELVWGMGMAVQKKDGVTITYPLITQPVELSLDDRNMALEIRPRAASPRMEVEVFAALDNPGVPALEEVAKNFLASGDVLYPDRPQGFEALLRSATSLLDASGSYLPDVGDAASGPSLPKAGESLAVTDTWVLMARPRAANLMVQDLERFAQGLSTSEQANDGDNQNPEDAASVVALPGALQALFVDPSTDIQDVELPAYRGLAAVAGSAANGNAGEGAVPSRPAELYFPKAYNDEQVQIVQMLDVHDGVVVQGPPGTGKTHTIANVICHYLASGKRVLVTSMKDPALAVLQEKLPEAIRPLAISLLASEADGMRQFDFAISKIAAEVTRIDRHQSRRDIEANEAEIDATHSRLAKIDGDIAHWAKVNLENVTLDDETLTPIEVAQEVAQFGTQGDWFPDVLTTARQYEPTFGQATLVALRAARMQLGADLAYLGCQLPDAQRFPAAARLLQAHQDLRQFAALKEKEASGALAPLSTADNALARAQDAVEQLGHLQQQLHTIEAEATPWSKDLQAYLSRHTKSEVLDLLWSLRVDVLAAAAARKQFLARPVHCPDGLPANAELCAAVDNLAAGRKPFGLAGLFGKTEAKRQLDAITVTGEAPASAQDWSHVQAYVQHCKTIKKLASRWNSLAQEMALPSCDQLPAMERAIAHIDLLQEARVAERAQRQALQALLPTWEANAGQALTQATAQNAIDTLQQHLLKHRLSQTWQVKEELTQALTGCTGAITEALRDFIALEFGAPTLSDALLQQRWTALTQELRRTQGLAGDLACVAQATGAIEACGAPQWAASLRLQPAAQTHDALIPDNWASVWRVRRLAHYVAQMDGRAQLKRLGQLRSELEADLGKLYQQAVTARTWLRLKENVTPAVGTALEAYRNSIKKIGKGTGVRAGRFRQDAREAAAGANAAIPCWIMPHYRISESLPSVIGDFDLVIIDEASQSDLSALPAIMRAKKILVVGDDKQVSPDGVGLEEEKIKVLRQRFLSSQVRLFAAQMTPDRSIYDLFKVVFASSSVMLREHFRSVAPIIEYSKREFYKHELRPLRMPRRSERLDPPLIDVYVEGGVKRADLNLAEAQFIVDEIKAIVADPALKGRSIGVVSLIGSKQALHIMQRVSEELGEEVLTEYQITCGDARTFQGKERDIMFLSMIASPGDAHPQSNVAAEQRFNVAASRARDRMYLVRSVRLEDLRPADVLRTKLIQHFQAPFLQNEQDLSANRAKCESPFEREVYDLLTEKGYRVIPQVPVGAYRIDMVVEGDNDGRLAIECDGDRYHGPAQWESDMRRQRILERAGWKFWRSFASTFVTHREEVVADLIATLTSLEIHPSSGSHAVASIHTHFRHIAASPAGQDDDGLVDADAEAETDVEGVDAAGVEAAGVEADPTDAQASPPAVEADARDTAPVVGAVTGAIHGETAAAPAGESTPENLSPHAAHPAGLSLPAAAVDGVLQAASTAETLAKE